MRISLSFSRRFSPFNLITAMTTIAMGLAATAAPALAAPTGRADPIDLPAGRIALSVDGNVHDKDDWVATPLALALLDAAGKNDRLVHLDYANELGADLNVASKEQAITQSVTGGLSRFGYPGDIAFNDQSQLGAGLDNFAQQINDSSASDPLWVIAAGPMETVWRGLKQADPAHRAFVHVISHSDFNQDHTHGSETTHTWQDLKDSFGDDGVTFVRIADQNSSNPDGDFNTDESQWQFLKNSDNPDWRWLYDQNDKPTFDASDAGMTYWFITGGPDGGVQTGGPSEVRRLLANPVPEPTSMALLAGALVPGLMRRRRRER